MTVHRHRINFASDKMLDCYEKIYERLIHEHNGRTVVAT